MMDRVNASSSLVSLCFKLIYLNSIVIINLDCLRSTSIIKCESLGFFFRLSCNEAQIELLSETFLDSNYFKLKLCYYHNLKLYLYFNF
jgi:hypothetical protein